MASYPPPAPPPPWPPYGSAAWRAQQRAAARAAAAAARQQRRALRYQLRAQRRGSIVGPLLLLALGVLFLMAQFGRISWTMSLDWLGTWWPTVLILAGIVLLAEWVLDLRRAQTAPGTGYRHGLGGGVVFLLILVAIVGLSSRAAQHTIQWHDRTFGPGSFGLDQLLGAQHDAYDSVSSPIAPNGALTLRNPHGDITITGTSTDGQVHVSLHKQVYGWSTHSLSSTFDQLQPTVTVTGSSVELATPTVDHGHADWTVTVPATTALTLIAGRGDVTLSSLNAPVNLSVSHGDVDLNSITGAVTLAVSDDDADLNLRDIHGDLTLQGRTGDIDIANVTGDASLQGNFYGTTHLAHIDGAVHFDTSRTHFSAARLVDEFSIDSDSLDATALQGPVLLKTSDKNITLDRVSGSADITNSNGSIELTSAVPLGPITVHNRHGSVDLGLPAASGFVLNAQTSSGDMENDFGLTPQQQNASSLLRGTIAGGGPAVIIATSDGDISLRKSSAAPLPPAPLAAPATKVPKVPEAPKAPPVPRVPKSYNF